MSSQDSTVDPIAAGMDDAFGDTTNDVDTSTDTEVTDSQEEVADETSEEQETTDESQANDSDEEDSDDTSEETAEESSELDQKEMARKAFEEREARRAEKQAQQKQVEQELLDQAENEQDLALKQLQIDAYSNKVERNLSKLELGFKSAVQEIEIFRNATPEVQEALGDAIDEFQARFVTFDSLDNPVEVKGDIYQFLNNKAGLIQKLTQVGARNEKIGQAKQQSAVTPPPTSSPKTPKEDPISAGLDAVFGK